MDKKFEKLLIPLREESKQGSWYQHIPTACSGDIESMLSKHNLKFGISGTSDGNGGLGIPNTTYDVDGLSSDWRAFRTELKQWCATSIKYKNLKPERKA